MDVIGRASGSRVIGAVRNRMEFGGELAKTGCLVAEFLQFVALALPGTDRDRGDEGGYRNHELRRILPGLGADARAQQEQCAGDDADQCDQP